MKKTDEEAAGRQRGAGVDAAGAAGKLLCPWCWTWWRRAIAGELARQPVGLVRAYSLVQAGGGCLAEPSRERDLPAAAGRPLPRAGRSPPGHVADPSSAPSADIGAQSGRLGPNEASPSAVLVAGSQRSSEVPSELHGSGRSSGVGSRLKAAFKKGGSSKS